MFILHVLPIKQLIHVPDKLFHKFQGFPRLWRYSASAHIFFENNDFNQHIT